MSIKNQFSKYAKEYNYFNIIQQIMAKALIRDIKQEPKTILELGCGSGQVFKYINWKIEKYFAIDFSPSMCKLHPKAQNIEISCFDFDSKEFEKFLKNKKFEMVLSSSSLQWSKNLDKLIKNLSLTTNEINAILFTSNTFKTIQNLTNSFSPILSINTIKEVFSKYFKCEFEVYNYNLEFENKRELFDYIKKSGVSGASPTLDFKKAKKLYNEYELNYLEFEVIFVKTISKL